MHEQRELFYAARHRAAAHFDAHFAPRRAVDGVSDANASSAAALPPPPPPRAAWTRQMCLNDIAQRLEHNQVLCTLHDMT